MEWFMINKKGGGASTVYTHLSFIHNKPVKIFLKEWIKYYNLKIIMKWFEKKIFCNNFCMYRYYHGRFFNKWLKNYV